MCELCILLTSNHSNLSQIIGFSLGCLLGFILYSKLLKKEIRNDLIIENNILESGDTIKDYILKYKSEYSKESIKRSLIDNGNSNSVVEEYLNKYY
jgi:hypothetical protein